jgi:hypothetical protein
MTIPFVAKSRDANYGVPMRMAFTKRAIAGDGFGREAQYIAGLGAAMHKGTFPFRATGAFAVPHPWTINILICLQKAFPN